MKKLLALLSLIAFLAVNVNAQTPQSKSADVKKEVKIAKAESKSSSHSCCMKANTACCKNKDAKNCTAEQKAACAKAGKECEGHAKAGKDCSHSKAEAEVPATKDSKSGLK